MKNVPQFKNHEPIIEVIIRWRDGHKQKQTKLYEVCIYNEQEFKDFKDGIYRARNNVLQGRT